MLRSAGAGDALAPLAVDTIMSYVNGFTIEERARKATPGAGVPRAERDAQFRAGLDLVLTGIRARIEENAGGPVARPDQPPADRSRGTSRSTNPSQMR